MNRGWFTGYKLHVVFYDKGAVQQSGITKGNVYDISFLKQIGVLPSKKQLLGDSPYISKPLRPDLFTKYRVKMKILFRINQHDYKSIVKSTGQKGKGNAVMV